jgi:hypothetical protein
VDGVVVLIPATPPTLTEATSLVVDEEVVLTPSPPPAPVVVAGLVSVVVVGLVTVFAITTANR